MGGLGNTGVVLGGQGNDEWINDIWYSSDGAYWVKATSSESDLFLPRWGHSSVVFDDKMWIIRGTVTSNSRQSTASAQTDWFSSDGIIWQKTNLSLPTDLSVLTLENKIWTFHRFVGLVHITSDGVTWTEISASLLRDSYPDRSGFTWVVFNNKFWGIAGSDVGYCRLNEVWVIE